MGLKTPDVRLSLRGVAQQFRPYLWGRKNEDPSDFRDHKVQFIHYGPH